MSKHQTCMNCRRNFVGPDSNINNNVCPECHSVIHEDCETQISEADGKILELQAEIKRLEEAIKNVPTSEYSEAQREGCDSNAAWDCFLEELAKWKKQALKGETDEPGN